MGNIINRIRLVNAKYLGTVSLKSFFLLWATVPVHTIVKKLAAVLSALISPTTNRTRGLGAVGSGGVADLRCYSLCQRDEARG